MPFVFPPIEPITKARGPGARWVGRLSSRIQRRFQMPLLLELAKLRDKVPTSKLAHAVLDQNEAHVLELSLVDRIGPIVASFDEPYALGLVEGGKLAVTDLGNDVAPERFVETARQEGAQIIGLSALLTTTMPSMKEVVEKLKESGLRDQVKVLVGGAPLTPEYASEIGADGYAPDAAEAAELASSMVQAP